MVRQKELSRQLLEAKREIKKLKTQLAKTMLKNEQVERTLLDSSNIGVYILQGGKFRFINSRFLEISGYSKDELLGKDYLDCVYPTDRDTVREKFEKTLKGESVPQYGYRLITSTGDFIGVIEMVSSIKYRNRRAVLGYLVDVTTNRHILAELALRAQTLDNINGSIILSDFDGRILYVNESACKLLGYDKGELLMMNISQILTPRELELAKSRRKEVKQKGELTFESAVVRKDGKELPVEVHCKVMQWDNKELFSNVFRDITVRKIKEKERIGLLHDLLVRAEEIEFLNKIDGIIFKHDESLDRMLEKLVKIIPSGWQYPDIAGCRIAMGEKEFRTTNFRKTNWCMREDIIVNGKIAGFVEVCYLEEKMNQDGVSFLKEEKILLKSISRRLAELMEHRRAIQILRESEIFALSLLNYAPNPMIVINPDYSLRLVNLAFEQLTGFSASELVGKKPPYPWWREEGLEESLRLREDYSQKPVKAIERHFQNKKGETLWVERSSIPVMDGGKLEYIIVSWMDITERKRAEELIKTVASNSPTAVYIIQKGKIVYANRRLQQYLCCAEHEIIDVNLLNYVHPEDREKVRIFAGLMLKGVLAHPYEYRFINKTGETRWAIETVTSIQYRGDRATLGNSMDITELKQLEKKVVKYEELNKVKSMFLSTISHELHTPLTAIKGYASLLLKYENRLEPEEKSSYLQSIDEDTERLTELVSHLLDVSRLDAGLLILEKAPTRFSELVKKAVTEAQLSRPAHTITLHTALELPVLNVDARRIREVLDNLIDNACKYSPEGTEVIISAEKRDKDLLISIADQGAGIPADELDKVFERMHRLEQRLAKDPGGLGLGLSLCKGLVEAHGGRIWAESEVDKGSTFYFTIPLENGTEQVTEINTCPRIGGKEEK